MTEERIQEILCVVQPTIVSEQKRKEVIDYFQRLINSYYGAEVFLFGSVSLKTYLPEGDIDLTVVSHQNAEEELARDVCGILGSEELDSEFRVNDVQYVCAQGYHIHVFIKGFIFIIQIWEFRRQVKIVKCSVKDIPVDISFDLMAGLSALCFPKQVLYRFLDCYSTFDWDNYRVSINVPLAMSSLPEIVADTPGNDGDELLLSQEFLRRCREIYSAPVKGLETTGHEFHVEDLTMVGPLKDNNNLERSVSED